MTRDEAIDIVRDAGFGYLATSADGQSYVRPMMPHLTEENELLLALLPRSRTIEHIKKNPNVEFCFVDRKMGYCRISGKAALSSDPEKKSVVWSAVPMLRQYFGGIEDPNFNLAVIQVEKIEAMTPHQKAPVIIS